MQIIQPSFIGLKNFLLIAFFFRIDLRTEVVGLLEAPAQQGRLLPHDVVDVERGVARASHWRRRSSARRRSAPNTLLLLDETDLQEQSLTPQGQQNVAFIQKTMIDEVVDFGDRSFAKLGSCPIDVPFLVVSHNPSVLECDFQVPVEARVPPDDSSIAAHFADLEKDLEELGGDLPKIRRFLSSARLHGQCLSAEFWNLLTVIIFV